MRKYIFIVMCAIFSINVAYAQLFYCPTGSYINIGNTEAQVARACGQPQKMQTGSVAKKQTKKVQQWFYSLGSNSSGSVRVKVVFSFKNGKVDNILLDNQKVDSVTLCNSSGGRGDAGQLYGAVKSNSAAQGPPVKVGDSAGTVETFCGEPNFINNTTQTSNVGSAKAAIWLYDFGPYQPKLELQFVNGKLDSIKKK